MIAFGIIMIVMGLIVATIAVIGEIKGYDTSRREAFVGGYRYGLREGKNPWHKVSEELPEPLIYVIVRFSNNTMAVSQRTNHFIGETTTVKVTHWMEIPEIEK